MLTSLADLVERCRGELGDLENCVTPLWHPLGFVSCEIYRFPSGGVARVHFWPRGLRRTKNPDWPIHTHSYALQSRVLAGQVRDIQYRAEPSGNGRIYTVEYSEGGSRVVKSDRTVQLAKTVDEIRVAGSEYSVPQGTFHQTRVHEEETALTIVLLSNHTSDPPEVVGTDEQNAYPYDRIPFDKDAFWEAVRSGMRCSPTSDSK
ncbi:MAG: hypothetical protein Tsb0027_24950 [Wenzhouxiangellaceae bacterium]